MLYQVGKIDIALFFIIIKIGSIVYFEHTAHRNWNNGAVITYPEIELTL